MREIKNVSYDPLGLPAFRRICKQMSETFYCLGEQRMGGGMKTDSCFLFAMIDDASRFLIS